MLLSALSRRLRRLGRDRSGVSIIEFAFALPIFLTIALTGIEVARLAITILRLNQLAMLAADNAARVRSAIDEKDIEEVAVGLRFAGENIKFGQNGRAIISVLEANSQTQPAKKGYQITWQRCFGAKNVTSSYGVQGDGTTDATLKDGMGPATPAGSPPGTPSKKVKPVTNSGLIFAELRYTYVPTVAPFWMPTFDLSSIQSFPVRDRAQQTLTNTSSMTDAQKRLCDAAHLSAT